MDSSSSSPLALLLSGQFYTMLNSLQSTKYLAVACFALLVYDYFLTLEQEVRRHGLFGLDAVANWR